MRTLSEQDHHATPSHATPPASISLPAATQSEKSTASSWDFYQGLSSLWLQILVSKLVLRLYGRDEGGVAFSNSKSTPNKGRRESEARCSPIRISTEIESVSLQLDVQERCTDLIFKVSSVECDFSTLAPRPPSSCDPQQRTGWIPYLNNSNGRLFSTSTSDLPEAVLRHTAPGFEGTRFQSCSGSVVPPTAAAASSPSLSIEFSSGSQGSFSPKFQPSFLYLKGHFPRRGKASKTLVGVELSVSAFEAVVWVPVVEFAVSVFRTARADSGVAGSDGNTSTHQLQVHIQWNLRIMDTFGTQDFVLCREVVLFQRLFCIEYVY